MDTSSDLLAMIAGATGWAVAIPAVQIAGNAVVTAPSANNKALALLVGIGIAYGTTPLLSKLLAWKTSTQKVRGVALVRA